MDGTPDVTPAAREVPSAAAHPLAYELAAEVARWTPGATRVMLLGSGSGRNIAPLLAAGARVDVVEEDAERAAAASRRFAGDGRMRIAHAPYHGPFPFERGHRAALSTHALLHGTPAAIAAGLRAARDVLGPNARLYITLGSTRDARFGAGTRIDAATFAPTSGSEAGIAHAYFDEAAARALLADFTIEHLDEVSAADSAGRWAHTAGEAATMVHWFARVRCR